MSYNFVTGVLCQVERFGDSFDSMTTVGVSSDIFVNALNTNLQTGASISKHLTQVWLQAVIRSSFNGDTNTLCLTLLRKSIDWKGVSFQDFG
jgi:hypothetical protein